MKRVALVTFTILVLSLASCCREHRQIQPAPRPDDLMGTHMVVGTLSLDSNSREIKGLSHGTGTVIKATTSRVYALTAGHVVKSRLPKAGRYHKRAVRFSRKGTWFKGVRIERTIDDLDAAIISFPPPAGILMRSAHVAAKNARVGDIVWTVGAPAFYQRTILHRVVAGTCGRDVGCFFCTPTQDCQFLDGPVFPGHSGGPVYNRQGEIVGIIISQHSFRGQAISGTFISVSTLRPLMKGFLQVRVEDEQ